MKVLYRNKLILERNSMKLLYSATIFIAMTISAFAQGGKSGSMFSWLPIIAIMFFVMYFFMIRPEQKKQKEKREMIASMQKGNKVMTIGGIHGTIHSVKDDVVILKVADNTNIKFAKSAISNVVTKENDKNGIAEKKK